MEVSADLYDDFILYVTPEKFYIEAVSGKEILVIDRVNQEICLQANHGQIPQVASSKKIYGIVGIIRLVAGPYLVVITKKKKVGLINGQSIWEVVQTEMLSYPRTVLHLTEKQMLLNRQYESMIDLVLNTPRFYFSYSFDITHTLQRLHNTTPEFLQMPIHERADSRFVWNAHLMRDLASKPELFRFCLPLIHGFVSINQLSVNDSMFTWSIVSRRCCFRAGTRFFARGIDSEGNVANFVEVEQIVECNGDRSSFVQTRGSIPLFWHQLPNLRLKPRPKLITTENHIEAFSLHMNTQIFHYGKQVLINLVDHRGAEDTLEKAYAEVISKFNNPNVRYESYDFHHECRNMRWDRLSILIDRLAHEQDEFSSFLMTKDGTVVSQQEGVFRTNCVDSLDRTNVVQSMLSKRALNLTMQKLHLMRPSQRLEDHKVFEYLFNKVWADNADVLSVQYSGTKALKTDFTRTGKRTKWGLLSDGINTLVRYYKNNYADGFRQDAIDLFLGNYVIEEGEGVLRPSPLDVEKGWKYITFPVVLLVAVAMFGANVITPSEYTTESLLYLLFWGAMVAVTLGTIMIYGPEFVDYPKLRDIKKTMLAE